MVDINFKCGCYAEVEHDWVDERTYVEEKTECNSIEQINELREKNNKLINLLRRIDHDIYFGEDLDKYMVEIRELGVYEVEDFS